MQHRSNILHYFKFCDKCNFQGSAFEIDYQNIRLNLCVMCEEITSNEDGYYDEEKLEKILAKKLLKELG
jgi:hypothetical protein